MKKSRSPLKFVLFALVAMATFSACKKYSDQPGSHTDPRFERRYCNVPEAVNYNWNFPGTPDVTDAVCLYPTDIFKGSFVYTDSIYSVANEFIRQEVKNIAITPTSRTKMLITGFCSSGSLSFTANRNLRADGDSSILNGQPLCRPVDTLSGYVFRAVNDSLHIQFAWQVNSDTGVFFHRGTAVKQ